MLPSKVWAEDPTGIKDREAAMLLLLLRVTLDHISQKQRDPGIPGCLIYQPLDWNVEGKKAALGSLLKSLQLFLHMEFSMGKLTGLQPSPYCSWGRRAHR